MYMCACVQMWQIADLEFVLNFMDGLSARVSEVEKLCRQTMEVS